MTDFEESPGTAKENGGDLAGKRVRISFRPSGRFVYEMGETPLLEAAARAGLVIATPCGGAGSCGKCLVRMFRDRPDANELERECLSPEELDEGYRLACQVAVARDLEVELFPESLLSDHHRILMDGMDTGGKLDPVVRKVFFDLPPPDRQRPESDLERLRGAVGEVRVDLGRLRELPAFMRKNDWRGTAVIGGGVLMGLEPGDTSKELYGVAFDLGTTTVVGTLLDLTTNGELLAISEMNPQIAFGDDVVSRIQRVSEDPHALRDLQEAIVETFNRIIDRLTRQQGLRANRVYEISVAGNTTMQQLFCGLDCSALAAAPFAPVFSSGQRLRADRFGLQANPEALVYVFPQIGGFVGGDTVSAILAARLLHRRDTSLLIDIGTNAEIAIRRGDDLYATSTAAGPAFEGARITNGMRARVGAIEKVVLGERDVRLNVIGNTRPIGLCGTALIDTVAELLRHGCLDPVGRLRADRDLPADLPPAIRDRFAGEKGERRFILAYEHETGSRSEIALWQHDVQELQLAAGAIRAGIRILLLRIGITVEELDEVLLAGAFGNFIRRRNARRIGMLPQVPCGRITFIGNATLLGAKLALLSREKQHEAGRIQRTARYIDLSLDVEFQREFSDAMIFPDGDLDDCREVRPFAGVPESAAVAPAIGR